MPIIETEIWKKNPECPGTVMYDGQRAAQDIFNELEAHLEADGRLPDEYFLFDAWSNWKNGVLFPKDGEILCKVNFGGSEGIYLDISVRYEKNVYEFNKAAGTGEWNKRMVIEPFATGKTLGDSIEDLDRMNLAASSVTAAFYGSKLQIQERYARIENGAEPPIYPIPAKEPAPAQFADKDEPADSATPERRGGLMDKLEANKRKVAEKDAMKNYAVEITETLQLTVEVIAKSPDEAEAIVRANYNKTDYILDAEHFTDVEFSVTEVPKKLSRGHKREEPVPV